MRLPERVTFTPSAWSSSVFTGYGGGLGPDTIAEQLPRIALAASAAPYWIDMERQVRSADDQQFLLVRVRAVLDLVEFMEATNIERRARETPEGTDG